ncbi:protein maelstrom homolog [Amyelois transitella]|uniref:protein maelstrom homolog n=1 Tax=Amyelois transitella TaxID=680683 RepID=UPI00298F5DD5|nr:protein maelstrom homolog [Amyelois transitella]
MPKKQPRNSFYFFMLDFKEEQRKKGIQYANMAEIANAAGPLWREAPQSVRVKFEAIAKEEKEKRNIPLQKFTSTGVPLSEIERQNRELQEAAEAEKQDINDLIKLKCFNKAIYWEDFYLMDVNYYCKVDSTYLIGEFAVLRFNLRDGIKEQYHKNINPGHIPTGYASDVKHGSQELGLEMPDEDPQKRTDYIHILAYIIDYLHQHNQEDRPNSQRPDMKNFPPIFTVPEKVEAVQDFIIQLCNKASEDDSLFRVYRLDTLLFTLVNGLASSKEMMLPKESLAMGHLKQDGFKYTPGLGCQHHEDLDKSTECAKSRVTRWAYSVLDLALPRTDVEPAPGKHVPHDYNIEGILQFKEQRKVRAGPSVASPSAGPSCSSTANTSLNDSTASTSFTRALRTHTPLRKPNMDFASKLRVAPEITEQDFKPITSRRTGRGRGDLAGSFNNMNISK